MGILNFLLRRKTAESLRKGYDRLRERADRESIKEKKLEILRMLDAINPLVVMLEEQYMSNYEKKAVTSRIVRELEKVKFVLNDKEAFTPMTSHEWQRKP